MLVDELYTPFNRELCRLDFAPIGCRPEWLARHRDPAWNVSGGAR